MPNTSYSSIRQSLYPGARKIADALAQCDTLSVETESRIVLLHLPNHDADILERRTD